MDCVGGGEGYTGNADNNDVTVRSVANMKFLHGGYPYLGNGSASGNKLWIYDSTMGEIHGGHTERAHSRRLRVVVKQLATQSTFMAARLTATFTA